MGHSILSEKDGGFRIAASKNKRFYYNGDRPKLKVYKTDPKGNFK